MPPCQQLFTCLIAGSAGYRCTLSSTFGLMCSRAGKTTHTAFSPIGGLSRLRRTRRHQRPMFYPAYWVVESSTS